MFKNIVILFCILIASCGQVLVEYEPEQKEQKATEETESSIDEEEPPEETEPSIDEEEPSLLPMIVFDTEYLDGLTTAIDNELCFYPGPYYVHVNPFSVDYVYFERRGEEYKIIPKRFSTIGSENRALEAAEILESMLEEKGYETCLSFYQFETLFVTKKNRPFPTYDELTFNYVSEEFCEEHLSYVLANKPIKSTTREKPHIYVLPEYLNENHIYYGYFNFSDIGYLRADFIPVIKENNEVTRINDFTLEEAEEIVNYIMYRGYIAGSLPVGSDKLDRRTIWFYVNKQFYIDDFEPYYIYNYDDSITALREWLDQSGIIIKAGDTLPFEFFFHDYPL